MKKIKSSQCWNPDEKKSTIIFFLFLCILPALASSEEIYKFERMWPTLHQPWYFSEPGGIVIDKRGFVYVADTGFHRIQKFTRDGQFITKWGEKGSEEGDFYALDSIAIDSSGFVYVADTWNDRIQKFTPDGQFITKWGKSGSGDGEFSHPRGMAIDSSGFIFVSDCMNNRIQKFTPNGEFIAKWGSSGTSVGLFYRPCDIAIDNNSNFVYVVDGGNNRIQKFTTNGEFITKWGSEESGETIFDEPRGVALDSNGFVYVADKENSLIQKFTSDGAFITEWGSEQSGGGRILTLISHPLSIAIDENDFIYVTTRDDFIKKFTLNGKLVAKWGSSGNDEGEFNGPQGIAIDSGGFVYISDLNDHIQKFTSGGQFVTTWGKWGTNNSEFFNPRGIAINSNDFVYVADDLNNRIQKFTPEGEFVTKWGTKSHGDDESYHPRGIAIDSNDFVYVTEMDNYCIKKFTSDGEFILKWGREGFLKERLRELGGIAIDSSDFVYVADLDNRCIQKTTSEGEFVLKWGKKGCEDGEFQDPSGIAIDKNGFVYVADWFNHCIQKFTPDGEFITKFGAFGSNPGQFNHPWGICVSLEEKVYVTDAENNRIQVFRKAAFSEGIAKAVIVAGGGPYPGNEIWDATQMCANFTYRTLTFQGFTKETIYYLTSDTDLDLDNNGALDDVDGNPTNNNLQHAITEWAENAKSLILYLVDHGNDRTFRMSSMEILSASDLDKWLDSLQEKTGAKIILIYDACQSGSFLSPLTAPDGKERIVVTSTTATEYAHFITQGSISFSSFFWTHIFNGLNIKDAFDLAKEAISASTGQTPLLDDNSNGEGNDAQDGIIASNTYIGNGMKIHGDAPIIGEVSPSQVINGPTAHLYASDVADNDGVVRVWAIIRPPDYNQQASNNPIYNLPSLELIPVGGGRYGGNYDAFHMEGTYHIAIYARDSVGNTSVPKLTTVSVENPLKRKAIIVASGSQSDELWPVIEKTATLVYEALTFQGYTDDDIYFMSPITFSSGVDGLSTLLNLSYAIETWARQDTQDLVVYMMGNGDQGTFRINDSETLSASDLDSWLDSVQADMPGKVTVIYDACCSGSFLSILTPPDDKERILFSSTGENQSAYFLSGGDLSFSNFFWRCVLNGMNVREAFLHAKNAIAFSCRDQTPHLDDNGNGLGNEKADGKLSLSYTIGVGIMRAGDEPLIGLICPVQTLSGKTSATIWADDVTTTGTIDKVWTVVTPPGFKSTHPEHPVTELPTIELSHVGKGRYEGNFDDFTISGTYQVAVYAKDSDNNISQPMETKVIRIADPDLFEEDDTCTLATVIVLNNDVPQQHSLHDEGDEDWVKFYGISDEAYTIKVSSLGSNCDVIINLYDTDGNTILASSNDGITGEDEILSWTCLQNNTYYVMVRHYDPGVFGEETGYDLEIYRPTAFIDGFIMGTVTDANSEKSIEGAQIRTNANASSISLPDGNYMIPHKAGTFIVTAVAPGYIPMSYYDVLITEGEVVTMDFELIGDSSGDSVPPTVSSFSVNPLTLTLGNTLTISYTVSDSGGSGLNRAELWCAHDSNGTPVGWSEIDRIPLSGNGPFTVSLSYSPLSGGNYWYGIHIVDNMGNVSLQPDPPGPIKVNIKALTPSAPTGVTATKGTYTDKIRVTWNLVSGATSYNVYRATSVGGPLSHFGTCDNLGYSNDIEFIDDTQGSAGITYYYLVKALNSNGESGYSSYDTGWLAASGCSATPTRRSFSSSGGTDIVSVTAPSGYNWNASSNDSWITITSESSGSGNGAVHYSVSSTTSTHSRIGTITITGETVTVIQLGAPWVYSSITPQQGYTDANTTIHISGENLTENTNIVIYGEGLSLKGSYNTSGCAYGAYVDGNYAYVADGDSGLQIIDISYPRSLILTGSYNTPGEARGIYIKSNYAYIADGDSGLQIIDIKDPENPSLTGNYDTSGSAHGIYIDCNYAYVADGDSGLQIIDISNPENPVHKGSYNTSGYAYDIHVEGNYAYVAAGDSGLTIIDISNPGQPVYRGHFYDASYNARGVYVMENQAFVTFNDNFGHSTLRIIDISNPEQPVYRGSYFFSSNAHGVYVEGNYAYVASDSVGLQIIDISNSRSPILTGSYNTLGKAHGIYIKSNYAYIADGDSGLQIIDISCPVSPALTGICNTPGWPYVGVYVEENYAYVADGFSGLQIIDISNPEQPEIKGTYETPDFARDAYIKANRAYIADRFGLHIIDINDPESPSFMGSYDTSGWALCVYVNGSHAYVADRSSGLQIIDISDPERLILTGSYTTSGYTSGIYVEGNYCYIAGSGLQIINISDPNKPALTGSYNTPGSAYEVDIEGNYAYVADGDSGLAIIDISDLENPLLISHISLAGGASGIYINNNYIYITSGSVGMQIIARPCFWPVQIEEINTEGTEIRAVIPSSLPVGFYTIRIINPAGIADQFSNAFEIKSGTPCSYSIMPTSESFSSSYGTDIVSVTAPSDCSWNASSNDSWITITSGSSGSGSATVSYSVAAHTSADSRTGTMIIGGQSFIVIQSGISCSYSVIPATRSFSSSYGTDIVSVTAPSGCNWEASSNDSWITITSESSGSGNRAVNYSVSSNTSTSSRIGTMTIAGETVTVSQSGVPCAYSIFPTNQSFDSMNGSGSVNVTTQSGCNWTATSNESWITITSGTSGRSNDTVAYSVEANTSTDSRTGTMIIAGNTFTVSQSEALCIPTSQIIAFNSPSSDFITNIGVIQTIIIHVIDNCSTPLTNLSLTVVFDNGDNPVSLVDNGQGIYSCNWAPQNLGSVTITVNEASVYGIVMANQGPVIDRDETYPYENAGIIDSHRVPCNTSIRIRIKDSDGIDLGSIQLIVEENSYTYNSNIFRVKEVHSGDITDIWIVYDSKENEFIFDQIVDVTVSASDAKGVLMDTPYTYHFKIENQEQYDNTLHNTPQISIDVNPATGKTTVASIDGSHIEGAMIIYDTNEPVKPTFGPLGEIPPLDIDNGIGFPLNLKPPTVFEDPVIIFIPIPEGNNPSSLNIYHYNPQTGWELAIEGDGWLVPHSRINHPDTMPPTIEVQVLHFSGVQAGGKSGAGDKSDSSNNNISSRKGCFISIITKPI
ncbi:MAG: BACON domain-containing protein [bacterium]